MGLNYWGIMMNIKLINSLALIIAPIKKSLCDRKSAKIFFCEQCVSKMMGWSHPEKLCCRSKREWLNSRQ